MTDVYPNMPIYARPASWTIQRRSMRMIKPPYKLRTRIYPILGFWGASGEAKFPKMGDSLPRTPMNHRAKFDATRFILGEKICNRTNKITKSKQTLNDISTPCLSACVDKTFKKR